MIETKAPFESCVILETCIWGQQYALVFILDLDDGTTSRRGNCKSGDGTRALGGYHTDVCQMPMWPRRTGDTSSCCLDVGLRHETSQIEA